MTLEQAVALHQRGAVREAAVAYVAFLRLRPEHPDALRLLAMALLELGHPGEALATFDRLPNRRGPVLAANRGQILLALSRWDEAAEALQRAVRDDPGLAEAWTALAAAEAGRGRAGEAARAAGRALVAAPSRLRAVSFADAVAVLPTPPADLRAPLLSAYGFDGVDHALLDRAAAAAVDWADPADPLLHAWLRRGAVPAEVEDRVVALRASLAGGGPAEAVEAVAAAAWASEYAWAPAGAERATAPEQRAMYRDDVEGPLPASLERLLRELPRREAELAREVPVLEPDGPSLGDDPTLRAMYEENPYPRRVSVQVREPTAFPAWWRERFPHAAPAAVPDEVDVLVAGCGTGRHALTSATAFRSRVTGVDLSRRSLARARRRSLELGVPLELHQADLRGLASWDRRFHVVESVGVLHHLPDWVAGLGALRPLLRPGGLVRLGLYAERARQDVVAARAFVAERGFADTADGIRAARAALRALPSDHPAWPVTRSVDFASVSGCRDLVFHVREHRVTLPELGAGLAVNGLTAVGFQHAVPGPEPRYAARWPDDPAQAELARWDALEREHPRLFAGMYVVWARAAE